MTTPRYVRNLAGAFALALFDRIDAATRAAVDLPGSDVAALITLRWYDGDSIGDLASAVGLSHSATVRSVDRLTTAGLVARTAGPDARTVALRLTPAGVTAATTAQQARDGVLAAALDALSADHARQMVGAFEGVLSALTTDRPTADHICRLCDASACPDRRCPVEQAVSL